MNNVGHCGLSEPNHISFAKNIYKVRGIREENRLVYIIYLNDIQYKMSNFVEHLKNKNI